jgi:phage protein D
MEGNPKPLWRIRVDGVDITAALDSRLLSLTHTDNRGMEADQLDLTLDDADGRLALPPRGAVLSLALGWEADGLTDKGSYTVDEVEHSGAPDQVTIRARSADLRAGLSTQRTRSFHQVNVAAIVNDIAAAHGLTAAIAATLAGELLDHLDQTNESDANLLTRLAGMFDAIATIKAGRVVFMPAGAGVSASGKPLPVMHITRADGDQHRFSIAERDSYAAVKALYNDIDLGQQGAVIWSKEEDDAEANRQSAPATVPATGEYKPLGPKPYPTRAKALRAARKAWEQIKKNATLRKKYVGATAQYHDKALNVQGEVRYGRTDDEKRKTQARKAAANDAANAQPAVDDAIEPSAENMKTLRHTYSSQANAKRAARTEWRRIQRGMAQFSLTLARGRPDLFPDLRAAVSGWKPEIDGTEWCLTRVTNNLSDSGYTTALEMEVKATELPG